MADDCLDRQFLLPHLHHEFQRCIQRAVTDLKNSCLLIRKNFSMSVESQVIIRRRKLRERRKGSARIFSGINLLYRLQRTSGLFL